MRKLLLRTAAALLFTVFAIGAAHPERIAQFCCGWPPPVCPGGPGCPIK